MSSYVAHSSNPDAVQRVRKLRIRTRLIAVLGSVGALLLLITEFLPEGSLLRIWLVILSALALAVAFFAYLPHKPREEVKGLVRTGTVRKVSYGVRRSYRKLTKAANINPCDDELFDYDKESQLAAEAVNAIFRRRHGRGESGDAR